MKKINRVVIGLFFIFYSISAVTRDDLNTAYKTATQTLQDLQNEVAQFSDEYKKDLPKQLNDAQISIDTNYNNALTSATNKPNNQQIYFNNAITTINDIVSKLKNKVAIIQQQIPKPKVPVDYSSLQTVIDDFKTFADQITALFATNQSNWADRITKIRGTIVNFPDNDKKNYEARFVKIEAKIASIATALPSAITLAESDLDNAKNKAIAGNQTLEKAQAIMNNYNKETQNNLNTTINLPESMLQSLEKEIQQEGSLQQSKKLRDALTPGILLYTALADKKSAFLKSLLKNQPYDAAQVQAFTDQCNACALSLHGAYQSSGIIIDNADASNFLIKTLRILIDYYCSIIGYMIRNTQRITDSQKYYAAMNFIVLLIHGIENSTDGEVAKIGFNKSLSNFITAYFNDTDQQLYHYYLQQKLHITAKVYSNLLSKISIQLTKPTQQELLYAQSYYQEINDSIPFLSADQQIQITKDNNSQIASLYLNGAQASLTAMASGQDNIQLLNQAIDNFSQAAVYYQQAGDDYNKNFCQQRVTFLKQANDDRLQGQQAEKSNDTATALLHYQNAVDGFRHGGDIFDAAQVLFLVNTILAEQKKNEGKSILATFIQNNNEQLKNYFSYLASSKSTGKITDYAPLLKNFDAATKDALAAYNQALTAYQALNSSIIKQTESTIIPTMQDLANAISLLNNLQQGSTLLNSGDQETSIKTKQGLDTAETEYYMLAERYYNAADTIIKKGSASLKEYIIDLSSWGQDLTWQKIAALHIVRAVIETAALLQNDPVISALYYSSVMTRSRFLPKDTVDYVVAQFKIISSKTGIDALLTQAQSEESIMLKHEEEDWSPVLGALGYSSKTDSQWRNVVRMYLAACYVGLKDARKGYISTLNEYAADYNKYVDSTFYPALGVAALYYQSYLLASSASSLQQGILKEITTLVEGSCKQVQDLINAVNTQDLSSTSIENQLKIVGWAKAFEQLVNEQTVIQDALNNIIGSIGSNLFTYSVDNDETIICTFLPTSKIVKIANPLLKLANLYKQIAQKAFDQKDYLNAYVNYYYALQNYFLIGLSDEANQLKQPYSLSYTLYTAGWYKDSVIPVGAVTLGSFNNVPESFRLQAYQQKVPDEIAQQLSPQELNKIAKDDLTKKLVALASQCFLYHKIVDAFGATSPAGTSNYTVLLKQVADKTVPAGQEMVYDFVNASEQYQIDLTARIKNNISSLYIKVIDAGNAHFSYILTEGYATMPGMPTNPPDPYVGFPVAYNYYNNAFLLYAPGNQDELVQVQGQYFVPGNIVASQQDVLHSFPFLYLSQGYSYQKLANKIKTSDQWELLLNIKNNDFNVDLTSYMSLFTSMQDYYTNAAGYYNGPLEDKHMLVPATDKSAALYKRLVADTYVLAGDDITHFLIGNPLLYNYTTILQAIQTNYMSAIVLYDFDPTQVNTLQQKTAQLFKNAGDLLVNTNNYFGALSYFKEALALCKQVEKPNNSTAKLLETITLSLLTNSIVGSTMNIQQYQQAKNTPITVTLTNGQQQTISFTDLFTGYQAWLKQSGDEVVSFDQALICAYNDLKGKILDALIYYQLASKYAADAAQALAVTFSLDAEALQKTASSLVSDFMGTNAIQVDTLDDAQAFITNKNFVDLVNKGLDTFEKQVSTQQDNQTKAAGYYAVSVWAQKLNTAVSLIYMQDYLGGVSAQGLIDVETDVKAELSEITNPSSQYLGTTCS